MHALCTPPTQISLSFITEDHIPLKELPLWAMFVNETDKNPLDSQNGTMQLHIDGCVRPDNLLKDIVSRHTSSLRKVNVEHRFDDKNKPYTHTTYHFCPYEPDVLGHGTLESEGMQQLKSNVSRWWKQLEIRSVKLRHYGLILTYSFAYVDQDRHTREVLPPNDWGICVDQNSLRTPHAT